MKHATLVLTLYACAAPVDLAPIAEGPIEDYQSPSGIFCEEPGTAYLGRTAGDSGMLFDRIVSACVRYTRPNDSEGFLAELEAVADACGASCADPLCGQPTAVEVFDDAGWLETLAVTREPQVAQIETRNVALTMAQSLILCRTGASHERDHLRVRSVRYY